MSDRDEGDGMAGGDGKAGKDWKAMLSGFTQLMKEFYVAPYRSSLARAARDEDDLFMLMVYSDVMGVPNPATYYMLELLPLLQDRFHEWHLRMGMEHSPLSHMNCC